MSSRGLAPGRKRGGIFRFVSRRRGGRVFRCGIFLSCRDFGALRGGAVDGLQGALTEEAAGGERLSF